jgi:hypothetical protein
MTGSLRGSRFESVTRDLTEPPGDSIRKSRLTR